MGIEREDWSDGPPAAETPTAEFNVQDLELLKPEADRFSEEADDGDEGVYTAEELAGYRQAIARGTITIEDARRMFALTDAEIEAVSKPEPEPKPEPRKSIDAELAEIRALRQSDPKKYWNEETQKRHLALLEAQEQRTAEREKVSRESPSADELRSIEKELAEIAKTRREDGRAYRRDPAMQARELELLERKEEIETEQQAGEQISATIEPVLEAAGDPEAFEAGFGAVFGTLSQNTQDAIRDELRSVPLDVGRPASQADVERFASSDVGADLVQEFGRQAGYKVAMLRARMDRMLTTASDRQAAEAWLDNLPAEEAKAILRTLAR